MTIIFLLSPSLYSDDVLCFMFSFSLMPLILVALSCYSCLFPLGISCRPPQFPNAFASPPFLCHENMMREWWLYHIFFLIQSHLRLLHGLY